MKYVIEGKDVYSHNNSIPPDGVIIDTDNIYEIGTFYGTHVGRPIEIKGNYLILDTSSDYTAKTITIALGQVHSIKKIVRCVHLREITAHNNEKFLVCACSDCNCFLKHIGDQKDCDEFCDYRRTSK